MDDYPLLGAHMSISGGLERALMRGSETGCRTIQLFTKSPNRWEERILEESEKERCVRILSGIIDLRKQALDLHTSLANVDDDKNHRKDSHIARVEHMQKIRHHIVKEYNTTQTH